MLFVLSGKKVCFDCIWIEFRRLCFVIGWLSSEAVISLTIEVTTQLPISSDHDLVYITIPKFNK
jgi:hypothetical protein